MPLIDVSDLLTDPDFVQSIVITRRAQSVDNTGRGVESDSTLTIIGCVTIGPLDPMIFGTDATYSRKSIAVHTRAQLYDATTGFSADLVTFEGNTYVVKQVYPWNQFGRGFYAAQCELQDLQTSTATS